MDEEVYCTECGYHDTEYQCMDWIKFGSEDEEELCQIYLCKGCGFEFEVRDK